MTARARPGEPLRVVIAGGGFAALEALLALRELAGDRVRMTLIAPDPLFNYRPAATVEVFDDRPPRSYDLRAITADLRATFARTRLEAVATQSKRVRLTSGSRLEYDVLILALGARAIVGVPGALTFRDQRDVPLLRRLIKDVTRGSVRRLVFVVPSGISWPLPMYELALLSAEKVEQHRRDTEILLVTPEPTPLGVFGEAASGLVADVLVERGVRFIGSAAPRSVRRDGALLLQFDGPLAADRVVAAPQLRAPQITGLPASWWGFVDTDALGRVDGLDDVYAAGDITTCPIKQGGLATQQADRIAHAIASGLGLAVPEPPRGHVLKARLVGAEPAVLLSTALDEHGSPLTATLDRADTDNPESSGKVFGRYLTPYVESLDSTSRVPTAAI